MASDNMTILANAYLAGTNDFQQRLPNPTQAGISAFAEGVFDPYNNDLYNQFVGLMNMIAFTYVQGRRFVSPLAEFKKERLRNGGKTVREIAPKWFKAHSFNPDSETLLKLEKPEFAQWFHTVNRQDQYEFSWIKEELQFAMLEGGDSGYGLNRLMAATMDALVSSDNYDEQCAMLALFGQVNEFWPEPIFNYQLTSAPTTQAAAEDFLVAVRSLIYQMSVQPSTLYNSVDVPVFARPEELILLVTPEVRANLDVRSWAAAFNLDYATTLARIVTVPEGAFGMPDTYAILTTVDFFACRDSYYGIEQAPYNPDNMSNKFYLQHWEIISASPLVPCIRFSTDTATAVTTVTQTVTGLTLTAASSSVAAGDTVQLTTALVGTLDNTDYDTLTVAPDSVVYEVTLDQGVINSRTYVDKYGVLHTQKTGLETGDIIHVTATSTYVNPSGATTSYFATVDITVDNGDATA